MKKILINWDNNNNAYLSAVLKNVIEENGITNIFLTENQNEEVFCSVSDFNTYQELFKILKFDFIPLINREEVLLIIDKFEK
jgi:hypothetical protein